MQGAFLRRSTVAIFRQIRSRCLRTLSLLPSCSHVTSLGVALRQDEFEGRASSLVAQCITGMTALQEAEAGHRSRRYPGWLSTRPCWELAQALSVNKTIRKLRLHGPLFGETEIRDAGGHLAIEPYALRYVVLPA
ncbi:hypothetical protein MTO96_002135 [Rhipicephalus appendiculatus]